MVRLPAFLLVIIFICILCPLYEMHFCICSQNTLITYHFVTLRSISNHITTCLWIDPNSKRLIQAAQGPLFNCFEMTMLEEKQNYTSIL